ncbi:MAG: hypothetical protein AAF383_15845 [Cyanobacteria bacterium P01_A01_bin.83]
MSNLQSDFKRKVAKLHRITVYGRWLFVLVSWFTLGLYALWHLKDEIALWFDYFTWAAVYYTFHFNFVPTFCLAFCVGITLSVLIWQSRNIILGLPAQEQRNLVRRVKKIEAEGKKHPLWRWINR